MVRKLSSYDPAIIALIYKQLEKRSLGFNDLVQACKMNHVTVNEYLANGKDAGEILKDTGRRGEYYLTPKGRDKLVQIRISRKMREQRRWYSGDVDPLDRLWAEEEVVSPIMFDKAREEMPLPLPARTALYGSIELDSLGETAESVILGRRRRRDQDPLRFVMSFLDHLVYGSRFPPPRPRKLGPKGLYKEVIHFLTAEWGRQIVKQAIRINIMRLLDLHRAYHNGKAGKDAPPLTLENIMGFDITFTVSYEGSRLRTSGDLPLGPLLSREQMKHRVVGWLLLEIAYEEGCDAPDAFHMKSQDRYHSLYETIPLLERASLLGPQDVDRIRLGGIVEVAFRYLQKAGALAFKELPRPDMWIEVIEGYVERCPRCHMRFGRHDRCKICKTPRGRHNPFPKGPK